ncbi:MAG TPA: hypothetical protein VET85_11170 [Stellaceae bacterium]|nr:hypothetical protein [Stellaceae bacterium]
MGADVAILHDRCVMMARSQPKEALERAKEWKDEGGGIAADHCIAMAYFELRDFKTAAVRFEELATKGMQMPVRARAQALDQAGQSWLDAEQPARAKADFDAAVTLIGNEPDLLIDRSEALAALKQYWEAIDDLNKVIDVAPNRADAFIYRGSAYRSVDAPDLALEDVEHGLKLQPDNTLGLLERGNLRAQKGDVAGARKDWSRVIQLSPKSPAAAAARADLARVATGGEAKTGGPRKKKPPEPADEQ